MSNVTPMHTPKAGTVVIGDRPHTHADLLRCFSGELDRLSAGWHSAELRTEALALAAQLDAMEPGSMSPLEMDAHELSDKLACKLDEIAGLYGLSFWIGNDGVWMYRPIGD